MNGKIRFFPSMRSLGTRSRFPKILLAMCGMISCLPAEPERAVTPSLVAQSITILTGDDGLAKAYRKKLSGFRVSCVGRVIVKLPDDREGSRHQKFIVKLASGQKLLVVHNIDLAKRVKNLKIGDRVRLSGEYVWNLKGGLVHETHRAPRGFGLDGWIIHRGVTYK